MKKRNQIFALLICFSMFLGMNASACAVFGEAEEERLVAPGQSQEILREFAAEIVFLEEKYGVEISEINDEVMELAKRECVEQLWYNEETSFVSLVDAIALAHAEYEMGLEAPRWRE